MVKLILYNISYSCGFDGSYLKYFKIWNFFIAPKNIISSISNDLKKLNPDILGLIEVDTGSIRTRKINNLDILKQRLNLLNHIENIKYKKSGYTRFFHHTVFLKNQVNAILSKSKFKSQKFHFLKYGTKKLVIEVSIIFKKKVTFLLVHLSLTKQTRKKQIKELISIINSIDGEIILMGDFNLFYGNIEIKNLINKTKLNYDFSKNLNMDSYPSKKPNKCLDLILVSNNIKVNSYKVINIKHSDHLPIFMDFEIK